MTDVHELPSKRSLATESDTLLCSILSRLGLVLRDENMRLEAGVTEDHSAFIMSKNQVLRELMAMQRTVQVKFLAPDMQELLVSTRALVDRNYQLLKMQVVALTDVTAFLTQAAVSEQGDGTYTRERQ